jgi:Lrp/AsnC family transcriptional regulator, leucine-responsive regulatory protein
MAGRAVGGWDDIDVRLLDLLQQQADRTLREFGELVGLTPSAVQRRIARYKQRGLISTVSMLDPDHTREIVRSIVLVTLVKESIDLHQQFKNRLTGRSEVQQCYAVSGRWDYVVVLTAPSVNACRELGDELFKADENVRRYETLIVFDAAKIGLSAPASMILDTRLHPT